MRQLKWDCDPGGGRQPGALQALGRPKMPQTHIVRTGETLHSLALGFFGDPGLFTLIANFNGIRNPGRLIPGQRIHIPDVQDLTPSNEYDISFGVAPPYGLEGILASFGNIYEYLNQDGT